MRRTATSCAPTAAPCSRRTRSWPTPSSTSVLNHLIVLYPPLQQTSGGATVALGQRVDADTGTSYNPFTLGGYARAGKSSREITLQNAKHRMHTIAGKLRIDKGCIDVAFNLYKLALGTVTDNGAVGLTKGGCGCSHNLYTQAVAICPCSPRFCTSPRARTACTCCCWTSATRWRWAELLAFQSTHLQVNVFELGRFVSFFTRRLHIKLPPTDPCIFVMRFASELQFGEKEHDVSRTLY